MYISANHRHIKFVNFKQSWASAERETTVRDSVSTFASKKKKETKQDIFNSHQVNFKLSSCYNQDVTCAFVFLNPPFSTNTTMSSTDQLIFNFERWASGTGQKDTTGAVLFTDYLNNVAGEYAKRGWGGGCA